MKIFYGSDIHLEFGRGTLQIPEGDILLLAGDIYLPWHRNIGTGSRRDRNQRDKLDKRFEKFFKECNSKFDHVYMVCGNHEHYHGNIANTNSKIKSDFNEWNCDRIELLHNDTVEFDTFSLFASTFWTDMQQNNPVVQNSIHYGLNDYEYISITDEDTDRLIRPTDITNLNKIARLRLTEFLNSAPKDKELLIMSHMGPFWMSVPEKYKTDECSYAYVNTGLDYLVDTKLTWIHGHTHTQFDYEYENAHVLCNPRGYYGIENVKKYQFAELHLG